MMEQYFDLSDLNLLEPNQTLSRYSHSSHELHQEKASQGDPIEEADRAPSSPALAAYHTGHSPCASRTEEEEQHVVNNPSELIEAEYSQTDAQWHWRDGHIWDQSNLDPRPQSLFQRPRDLPRGNSVGSQPIEISNMQHENIENTQDVYGPLQRWRDSSPGDDAALPLAYDTLSAVSLRRRASTESLRRQRSTSRPASISSINSGCTTSSSHSVRSSKRGFLPKLLGRRFSRETTKAGRRDLADMAARAFHCTFCCDTFKSKYDWYRHEKALHLRLERWVCTPHGGAVLSPLTGQTHCAYCNAVNPTTAHLSSHNHQSCKSSLKPPIFHRKDHLVQHMKLSHQLEVLPLIDEWKVEAPPVISRCGFCSTGLNTWNERIEHLALHFRQGKTMDDWKGDHGFHPDIAAQVTNAMPPYLIGNDSRSPLPFSATNRATRDHVSQIQQREQEDKDDRESHGSSGGMVAETIHNEADFESTSSTTFIELLTRGLGNFARQKIQEGIVPTDEMFQQESRRLIYGTDDAFDQTIADNIEWLSSLRQNYL